jgi:precorrin-6Y C5,15-methyltransferase (decarboxylating)
MVEQYTAARPRPLGLSDESFEQRRPLRGQITKREVRAVSLYSLGIRSDSVIWDIGAATGSVSIEAGVIAHRGRVYAIERDEASMGLLRSNVENLAGPNVMVVCGEAPAVLAGLPDPDSVFVGGSGGHLAEILDTAADRLNDGGRLVVNLAALERTQEVYHRLKDRGMAVELTTINASRGREMPDGAVRLEALNPVFIITAQRVEQTP